MAEKRPLMRDDIHVEPKFCKCRLCHAYFYGGTMDEARAACEAHHKEFHPEWDETACFCSE